MHFFNHGSPNRLMRDLSFIFVLEFVHALGEPGNDDSCEIEDDEEDPLDIIT